MNSQSLYQAPESEPKPLTGEVVRPSKPVIPTSVKTWYVLACIAVLFQGVLNTLQGVFILSQAQNSTQQFVGSFTLVWGIVMSVLGVFVVRKSRGALIAAIVIYTISSLLALVSNPFTIIGAALFLTPMIGGITALNKMESLDWESSHPGHWMTGNPHVQR